jgi:hypothetical protein
MTENRNKEDIVATGLNWMLDPLGAYQNDTQQKAIDIQIGAAKEQNNAWMQQYTDLSNQGDAAYLKSKNTLSDLYKESQTGLQTVFATRDVALNDLLAGIRTTGRNQSAQSGLIGGGQESSSVDPALQSASQNESSTRTNMQSDLLNQYNNALMSLDQTNLARIGNLTQGAMSQAGSLNQGYINSLNNYANPAGAAVGGGLSGLSAGLNLSQLFK